MEQKITFREGVLADSFAVLCIVEEAFADLVVRQGLDTPTNWGDEARMARAWEGKRPLFHHLANTAEHFWVAERLAAEAGRSHFGVAVSSVNETAVTHLLQRGFKMDGFVAYWMCERPFGKLENYIISSPPYFL